MTLYTLTKSNRKGKRFQVYKYGEPPVHFGSDTNNTYIDHNDTTTKNAWIARHGANSDFTNPSTASFWAYWLLWNRRTLKASIRDIKRKFNITVIY